MSTRTYAQNGIVFQITIERNPDDFRIDILEKDGVKTDRGKYLQDQSSEGGLYENIKES